MIGILAIFHAMIDAASVSTVFSSVKGLPPATMVGWILIYNLLAFAPQVFFGALMDLYAGRKRHLSPELSPADFNASRVYLTAVLIGAALVIIGAAFKMPMAPGICFVAIGNSIFHVGGGGYTLHTGKGKAAWAGVFVGPGSLGLALGTLFPQNMTLYAIALTVLSALVIAVRLLNERKGKETAAPVMVSYSFSTRILTAGAFLLCLAVAFRAFGGSFPAFSWKTGTAMALMTAIFVMVGKMSGGFACDKFGAAKTILVSILLAAPLIAFFPDQASASLAGLLFLNISMPITLILLYRYFPRYPAFSFGLAASSLLPGTLAGDLARAGTVQLHIHTRSLFFMICSLLALFCVLIANRWITKAKTKMKEAQIND